MQSTQTPTILPSALVGPMEAHACTIASYFTWAPADNVPKDAMEKLEAGDIPTPPHLFFLACYMDDGMSPMDSLDYTTHIPGPRFRADERQRKRNTSVQGEAARAQDHHALNGRLRMFLYPATKWDPPKAGGYNSYKPYDYVMDLLDPNDPFTRSYLAWLNSAVKFPTEDLSRKRKTPPSSTDSSDNASDVHAIKAHHSKHLQLASTTAPTCDDLTLPSASTLLSTATLNSDSVTVLPLPPTPIDPVLLQPAPLSPSPSPGIALSAEAAVGVSAMTFPATGITPGTPVASMDVDVAVQDMSASATSKTKPKPTTKSKSKPATKSKPKPPAKDANGIRSAKKAPTTKKAAPTTKKAKAAPTRISARNKTGERSRMPLTR
ncbi:hypothetical protein OF83DRAFT_1188701, partial [Amylostereum chailletii]